MEQRAFAIELPGDLCTFAASPQAWRWRYIERLSGRSAHHARFFCSLEESSHRATILAHPCIALDERRSRLAQLGQVVELALRRLDGRASGQVLGTAFDPRSREVRAATVAVATWSRIQLALLLHYYGIDERTLDQDSLEEAFLMFSSGRLRVPIAGKRGIGEPDSAYYFLFAEFALLACDLGIDADMWEPQLAHRIWTQEVYVHMQRPVGPPPHRFHEYAPRGKERVFEPGIAAAARERIAGRHSRIELEPFHTDNCRAAFGDRQRG